MIKMENKLRELTDQLRRIRKENEFNEIDLEQCEEKLKRMSEELDQPVNISIEQEVTTFINKIIVSIPWEQGKDNFNHSNKEIIFRY
jgi:division protein CdvB (Snf7/Vps24/ESCRT-III family)